jgi:hypothetical protein
MRQHSIYSINTQIIIRNIKLEAARAGFRCKSDTSGSAISYFVDTAQFQLLHMPDEVQLERESE